MKISNETKIGALTAIAITLLVLGFNFLKGRSVFKSGFFLKAEYSDTKHLTPSNPVFINGLQVGSVYEIEAADKSVTRIIVTIKLNKDYNVPDNSVAVIKENPLSSTSIDIRLGDSKNYLKSNSIIQSIEAGGLLGNIGDKLGPVADQLIRTFQSLDTLLRNVNTVLDPSTKNNLQSVVANLNHATGSLVETSNSLQQLLSNQSSAIAGTLQNLDTFTNNLAANNVRISNTLANLETTSGKFASIDLNSIVNRMQYAANKLDSAMTQLNTTNGSLGALINDKELYNRLNNTVVSLHTLMDDLRVHPKRYVNISIFGKKDKGNYLTAPLAADSTYTSGK
ncbi:MAG: MlaD family protein [Ilyomonas sp.]